MNIAVLTCTRDRVGYTYHCFNSLQDNAGCDFDHYVLDNASDDDTLTFLEEYPAAAVIPCDENIGIHAGWNTLLDAAGADYDAYVTFDNDCEVTMHGTLEAAVRITEYGWVVSPTVLGLKNPPVPTGQEVIAGVVINLYPAPGGIFRALPGSMIRDGFRFDESLPKWGGDEGTVAYWARDHGLPVGYLQHWTVNHFETTAGQEVRFPSYFARKYDEIYG